MSEIHPKQTTPHQTTPHTQTHQDTTAADDGREPDQLAQDTGRGSDVDLYANTEGGQSAGSRSAHITNAMGNVPPPQQETPPVNPMAMPHTDKMSGASNHPIAEEDKQQERVGSRN